MLILEYQASLTELLPCVYGLCGLGEVRQISLVLRQHDTTKKQPHTRQKDTHLG